MSHALLIHDEACERVYVYVDGILVLDLPKSQDDWQADVAEVLASVREASETAGSVDACDAPPPDLSGWSGLLPIERYGEDSLGGIIDAFSLGVVATILINSEWVFGQDFFFPGDAPW